MPRRPPRWTSLCQIVRFSRRGDLAIDPESTSATALPRVVADLVAAAATSMPDEQALLDEVTARTNGALSPRDARAIVAALRRNDLLVDAAELRPRLSALAATRPSPPVAPNRVVISTCDRPAALRACLVSHLESARRYGRSVRILVTDDSRAVRNRSANQRVIAAEARRSGVAVDYLGIDGKRQLIERLHRATETPVDVLDYLLFDPLDSNYTPGANRNAALLALSGEPFVIVDDDTLCRGTAAFAGEADPILVAAAPPAPFAFPDLARGSRLPGLFDLIGAAERFLGSDLARLAGQPLEIAPGALAALPGSGPGRVSAVVFGSVGDHGMAAPWSILWQEGEGRRDLLRSAASYRRGTEIAAVRWAAARPVVARTVAVCSGMALALDNRQLLPPFAPLGRSEDMLFAALLSLCDPSALFAVSPWAIAHRWNSPRRFVAPSRWRGLGTTNFNNTLRLLLRSRYHRLFTEPGAVRSPADNLPLLGAHLAALGGLTFEQAIELWQPLAVERARELQHRLDSLLDRHPGAPAYWSRDIERQRQTLRTRARSAGAGWPSDLGAAMSADAYRSRFVPRVDRLGRALCHWPALHAAAREIGPPPFEQFRG